MKLKKKLTAMLSFLLLSVLLLTGCSPEVEELATDVITGIIEAELENTDSEDFLNGEELTLTEEEMILEETEKEETAPEASSENTSSDEEMNLEEADTEEVIDEDGSYTSKDEVAAYLNEYGHLPSNFITKKEARSLGWVSSEGNLWEVAPGMSIGGDYFGNYEGNLPEAKGRDYYECDIDTDGSYRGAKRIVFSNDGLIYYTEDHYETFELLYGEE